jgi:hypothetical protein
MAHIIRGKWRSRNPQVATKAQKGSNQMELDRIIDELQSLRGELHGLREDLRHYQGFVGGVAWIMGGVAAVAGMLLSYLKGELL